MRRLFLLLLLPLSLFAEELEVRLSTRSNVKPLYISRLFAEASPFDWRYLEELRTLFEFDFNTNGFTFVIPSQEGLETSLGFPDPRVEFPIAQWKKEKISYLVTLQLLHKGLVATAFQIERETSKRYPEIAISGVLEEDRRAIHRLTDTIQKDLFGIQGIASLKILFAYRSDFSDLEWRSEIWSADPDGGNARPAIKGKGYHVSPLFFPRKGDEEAFLYVSFEEGQSKIYCASLKTGKKAPFLSMRGNQLLPSISPLGNQIAFIADIAGRPDLFIQNLDPAGQSIGKARQLFSLPRATQASPTYSPDGKKIAFVSDKDGPPRIYTLEVQALRGVQRPRPVLLTKKNRENTSPAWSPDGKKLAYSAKVDGVRQIWLYDFETEEEFSLTSGGENKENPSWAPDSLHLLYNTESDDVCELFLLNISDPKPVQITKGPGQKRFPCWSLRDHL